MKKCLKCNIEKPLTEYHKDKSRKTGLREQCKACRCKYEDVVTKSCIACDTIYKVEGYSKAQKYCSLTCQRVYIKYKINKNDLKHMVEKYRNKCAICKKEETATDKRTGKKYKLSIDHCHKTGKVRGLLCGKCNAAIGYFKDDIKLLKNAIKYLKENN
jgi:hypothetical protein